MKTVLVQQSYIKQDQQVTREVEYKDSPHHC
jgi:hypothetical protein